MNAEGKLDTPESPAGADPGIFSSRGWSKKKICKLKYMKISLKNRFSSFFNKKGLKISHNILIDFAVKPFIQSNFTIEPNSKIKIFTQIQNVKLFFHLKHYNYNTRLHSTHKLNTQSTF